MAEHKEQNKKSIRFFNDHEVRAVWDDSHNKWWFSVLDIIAAINEQDDYQKTKNYWRYLKTKLKKENSKQVSGTNQFKLQAPDGKQRLTETLDGKGVVLLAKAIPNVKARAFFDWVTYSGNTIDGQSKKNAYQLFESGILQTAEPGSIKFCNRYTLISLEGYVTLLDKSEPRIYPKEALRLLIVCTSLKLCKQ